MMPPMIFRLAPLEICGHRGGGAKCAHVQLAGHHGIQAVGRVLEFHQLDIQPFLGEQALLFGDKNFGGDSADSRPDRLGQRQADRLSASAAQATRTACGRSKR
ncbi:MAG: hypothetical protein U1E47_00145 [Rivihabitans pingtungensis]